MPFSPDSKILTLPVNRCGFRFPSISRINVGIALQGLHRDLNHHIPAYCQITLADWTCLLNKCINPISCPNHCKSQYPKLSKIPAMWIIAQKALQMCPGRFRLLSTDQSHIINGDVLIAHCLSILWCSWKVLQLCSEIDKSSWLKMIRDIRLWEMDVLTGSTKFTQKPMLHSQLSHNLNSMQWSNIRKVILALQPMLLLMAQGICYWNKRTDN